MELAILIVLLVWYFIYSAKEKQKIRQNNIMRMNAGVFRPSNISEEIRLKNVYIDNWYNSQSAYKDDPDIIPFFKTSYGQGYLHTYAEILAGCALWEKGFQPTFRTGPLIPNFSRTMDGIPPTPPMQKAAFISGTIKPYIRQCRDAGQPI